MYKGRHISAVVTAAGDGSRMKSAISKLWIDIEGRYVLLRTLDALWKVEEIDEIILVIKKEQEDITRREILPQYNGKILIAYGGESREDSVFNGMRAASSEEGLFLIHDGARPFVRRDDVLACLEAAHTHGAAVLGVPATDTIKRVDEKGFVLETPERRFLYHIQTPQIFEKELLFKAYALRLEQGIASTDDAKLVEALGKPVQVTGGSRSNIKITTMDDLVYAQIHIRSQEI